MKSKLLNLEQSKKIAPLSEKAVVTPGRLELPTNSLGNCCSIHLSYGAAFIIRDILIQTLAGHFDVRL
jgi:hypothetical protein